MSKQQVQLKEGDIVKVISKLEHSHNDRCLNWTGIIAEIDNNPLEILTISFKFKNSKWGWWFSPEQLQLITNG